MKYTGQYNAKVAKFSARTSAEWRQNSASLANLSSILIIIISFGLHNQLATTLSGIRLIKMPDKKKEELTQKNSWNACKVDLNE